MNDTMSVKKALKNLWGLKADADKKGKAVSQRPGVARVTEVIRALIPLIILGLVLLILHFAAPSAFNWVISYGSLGAKLTGSLVPAAIALLTIGIGVGNRVKHSQYLYLHNSNDNSGMFNSENLNKNHLNSKDHKLKENTEQLNEYKDKIEFVNYLKNKVETIIVNESQLSETDESHPERELNIKFHNNNNLFIGEVEVKIPLSNDTPFIKVKYLIAKHLELIQGTAENQTMPFMDIFVSSSIKDDNEKIGETTNIEVEVKVKQDNK